jgi:alanine racemase
MTNQWIEVDASRLATNMRAFRRHLGPDVLLAPVVKSNGYGHGLERAARAFVAGGANWLCVHAPAEARRALAERLDTTVLIMGPWDDDSLDGLVRDGVHLTLSSPERIDAVEAAARRVQRAALLHLKVETGTHRQGLPTQALRSVLARIAASDQLELVGLHSHFANIEDTTRHEFAAHQVHRFHEALQLADELGVPPRVRHIASSAAAMLFPHTHYDLVRPGIAAYGYWPSRETLATARELGLGTLDLAPALTWKSVLTEIKTVPAGSYIGYGCTDKVEVDTKIGIVPVGYADGYRRVMGGRAHVLVQGRHCRVRGRICMNLMMVDVRHLDAVAEGDEVVLLGRQRGEEISAEQLADWAQTIHYEVLAGLSAEIPRTAAG